MKKAAWIVFGTLATLVGLYPLIYFVLDSNFGLLASKPEALLADGLWNTAFYGHILLGGLALFIGWIQFNQKLRNRRLNLHRRIGKVYMLSVFISGICGLYIALYATGGIISVLGFFILGIVWLSTTFLGLKAVKKRNIEAHEKWMILSYAACFAAVTLRIWLPILSSAFGEFIPAYRIVAWLCWVPNMIIAYLIVRKKGGIFAAN